MTSDENLILGQIDAVGLVVGDVTFDPLDVGSKLTQCFVRFLCSGLEFLPLSTADSRKFPFDHEFSHGVSRYGRPKGI